MDQVTHLLDTHAVIWAYQDSENLGQKARLVIEKSASRSLAISDFTLLELAMLVQKSRVQMDLPLLEFLRRVEKNYVVFPAGSTEAFTAVELQLNHGDPFDRVIVATARCRGLPLLTKDRQITEAGMVEVVW